MRKERISLVYVRDKISYETDIDREMFMDQMQRFAIWYAPDNNNINSRKLCELIPDLKMIRINRDIIDTQDVPFFEYTTYSNPDANILKFRRPFKVIWEILQYYCDIAVSAK